MSAEPPAVPESEERPYRVRCKSCGHVCAVDEPYDEEEQPDHYLCDHCGSMLFEAVGQDVPLSPTPWEGHSYSLYWTVPGTGELVFDIPFDSRGEALSFAGTFAWHEQYRISEGSAERYWELRVRSTGEPDVFVSSRDVVSCRNCGRVIIRTFNRDGCECGEPFPIAEPGPRLRDSALADG